MTSNEKLIQFAIEQPWWFFALALFFLYVVYHCVRMVFTCRHQWARPDGRRQECTVCGIIRTIPCDHHWVFQGTYTGEYMIFGGEIVKERHVCKKCGEVKLIEVTSDD